MPYLDDDFLLDTETARTVFHQYAATQPIIDYHCHLSPTDLANNRRFANLTEIWLEGDHYKWRAMRLNGSEERFCTGDADPYDKFLAYAQTVPHALRNPLHHWSHLELRRYFGIDEILSPDTAPEIWEKANNALQSENLSTWGILDRFQVRLIGTTDDPTDDLADHRRIRESDCPAKVIPSFRPDKAFGIDQPETWNRWIDRLQSASGIACDNLDGLLQALAKRIHFFDTNGCIASDHGLANCPRKIADTATASALFDRARTGDVIPPSDAEAFTGFLLVWLGERYREQGWVMQLHLGAIRNVNRGMFTALGPDIGCDSIDDREQIAGLATVLGELSARDALPRTVLYNLDPAKNYAFATFCGNFFEPGVPAKVQFGSGWWFLDQLEGMESQLNALSNLGLLSRFIGMLTDSRSLMSYPRHEYFRRLLSRILGRDLENGLVPDDIEELGALVERVSYGNAADWFLST